MRVNVRGAIVCFSIGIAGGALAEPSELLTPGLAAACEQETGTAAGVCRDYCNQMACVHAEDGDDATEPAASAADCQRARARFQSLTGRDVPCERLVACPCADPANWASLDDGMIWQSFALKSFSADLTRCSDDSSRTRLWQDGLDDDTTGAGADTALAECEVIDGDRTRGPRTVRVSGSEARACRELLRDAGGSLCD